MAVKFLTEEWAKASQEALNGHQAFKSAIASQQASLLQVISTPEGEKSYWIKLEGGDAFVGVGDFDGSPDATIREDYETASGIAKNELSPVAAYMSGKLRVDGDLMKLMSLQGVLAQLPAAMQSVEVEY